MSSVASFIVCYTAVFSVDTENGCVADYLFYDACFAEKSQDLIFPQDSISFDSIGFYNTFRFSSLRSRDFVPEEMVDILGNHCTGCKG